MLFVWILRKCKNEMLNLFKQYEGVFPAQGGLASGEEYLEPKKSKGKAFNYSPFALQDAIGEKSAKKAWLEYQKLRIAENIGAEELIFNIINKIRNMLFISLGANKEDLDMKDFPFNKSKKDAKNWKIDELKSFHTKLVEIYHISRLESGHEFDLDLEKVLLSI